MSVKENIHSLGIPKVMRCPVCGKIERLNTQERSNLAECMMNNCKGLWALLHCDRCGYVKQVYPTRINGIACTKIECIELFEEMKKYDEKENEDE